MTSTGRARLKERRARWRRDNHTAKYQELAAWVRRIREQMRMFQSAFAEHLGVSEITVRRWELAWGYMPCSEVMEKLQKLALSFRMKPLKEK
jgi:ribosome-binding protein aMBF1 (putative translation factor)